MIEESTYVGVYRNLRNGMFSLLCPKTRKVISWQKDMVLTDCKFKVRKSGRLEVIRTKQKNVHAFVFGYYKKSGTIEESLLHKVKYNPYYADHFFLVDKNERIDRSDYVYFKNGTDIYAKII